jgi:putative membrane protein
MASERRLHPLSFVFAIQESAKQFLFPALVALFAAGSADAWELWAGVLVVPLAVVAIGRSLSFRYRFDPTELVIRSGFIFRRVRHIPYDRVQNVDAVQNVLHRLLGVIEVRVETGGGEEAEAFMRVVGRDALDEIRERIFAGRSVPADAPATPAAPDVLLSMPPREVFLFGLVHGRGTIVLGALISLLWEFGLIAGAGESLFGTGASGRGVFRQIAAGLFDDAPFPVLQVILSLLGLVLVLGTLRVASAGWTVLKYYGFTLARSGDDLRCEYGLFTRVTSTIPVRRIQKVTIREGPWHRVAERVSVGVQTAGGKVEQGGESTRSWLAPLVRRSALPGLLDGIIPEATADVPWQPVHPRGVRREFVGAMVFVLPLSIASSLAFRWWSLVLLTLLTSWLYVHARRSVAAMRWAVSNETVQFTSGWIWRNRLVAPLTKVQVVSRSQSPFDRRHHMATVFADTAGRAHEGYAIRIPYLAVDVAATLAHELSSAAARTSFKW